MYLVLTFIRNTRVRASRIFSKYMVQNYLESKAVFWHATMWFSNFQDPLAIAFAVKPWNFLRTTNSATLQKVIHETFHGLVVIYTYWRKYIIGNSAGMEFLEAIYYITIHTIAKRKSIKATKNCLIVATCLLRIKQILQPQYVIFILIKTIFSVMEII